MGRRKDDLRAGLERSDPGWYARRGESVVIVMGDGYASSMGVIGIGDAGISRDRSLQWLGMVGSGEVGAGRDGRSLRVFNALRLAYVSLIRYEAEKEGSIPRPCPMVQCLEVAIPRAPRADGA